MESFGEVVGHILYVYWEVYIHVWPLKWSYIYGVTSDSSSWLPDNNSMQHELSLIYNDLNREIDASFTRKLMEWTSQWSGDYLSFVVIVHKSVGTQLAN